MVLSEVGGPEQTFDKFAVEATFITPYSTTVGDWDYGFGFFNSANENNYSLAVRSNNTWFLGWSVDTQRVAGDALYSLDRRDFARNRLTVEVYGSSGRFFVNDVFVSDITLSNLSNEKRVEIISGVFVGAEIPANATQYENFAIYELP